MNLALQNYNITELSFGVYEKYFCGDYVFGVFLCNAQSQRFELNWSTSKVLSTGNTQIELPHFDAKLQFLTKMASPILRNGKQGLKSIQKMHLLLP